MEIQLKKLPTFLLKRVIEIEELLDSNSLNYSEKFAIVAAVNLRVRELQVHKEEIELNK